VKMVAVIRMLQKKPLVLTNEKTSTIDRAASTGGSMTADLLASMAHLTASNSSDAWLSRTIILI
jgi:hypothetical protein